MIPGFGSEQSAPPQARVHFCGGHTLDVLQSYAALSGLQEGIPTGSVLPHRRDTDGRLLTVELAKRNGRPVSVNWTAVAYVEPV